MKMPMIKVCLLYL